MNNWMPPNTEPPLFGLDRSQPAERFVRPMARRTYRQWFIDGWIFLSAWWGGRP